MTFLRAIPCPAVTFGEGGCSMKITEDVRKFAVQQISEEEALRVGLEQKAKEFAEKGGDVYTTA